MEDRTELLHKLINSLAPYGVPVNDIKNTFVILMNDYEIQTRCTQLVVREDDKVRYYCNKFLIAKKISGCTDRTIKTYTNTLKGFFKELPKDPTTITADEITMYFAVKETRDKVSKGYIVDIRRVLSSFFGWLQENDMIVKNPMKKVEMIRYKPHKEKAFSDDEVESIRFACRDIRETTIIETLLSTGCRVSELVSIKIADIDKNDWHCEIFGKGEKYRDVFFNARSRKCIEVYLSKREDKNLFLFPSTIDDYIYTRTKAATKPHNGRGMTDWWTDPGLVHDHKHIDKSTIENIVRDIGKRANVDNVHPHRFRKTCATNALRKGMPIEYVSKMLGHESLETTQIYLDLSGDEMKNLHRKYV